MEAPLTETEELLRGASCALHEGADASFLCTRCGSFGCPSCAFSAVPEREVCSACAQKGLGEPIPWERRKELGTWRAFWRTAQLASRTPTAFFRTPTTQASPLGAMIHGVATYTFGLLLSYLVMGILVMLGGGAVALFGGTDETQMLGAIIGGYGCLIAGMSPMALLFAPAGELLGLVIAAGASHGTLALFKKTRGSFEDTLRALSYANAPRIWVFIPVFGVFSYFWMLGVEVIALRETHRCGTDMAVLAALGFRVVLFVAVMVLYAALIGMVLVLEPPR